MPNRISQAETTKRILKAKAEHFVNEVAMYIQLRAREICFEVEEQCVRNANPDGRRAAQKCSDLIKKEFDT